MWLDSGPRPLLAFALSAGYTWFVIGAERNRWVLFIAGLFVVVPFVVLQWQAAKGHDIEGRRFELQFTFAILTHFVAGFGVTLAILGRREGAVGAIVCVVVLIALERVGEKLLDRQM